MSPGFQQAVIKIENEKDFAELRGAMDRVFTAPEVEKFLRHHSDARLLPLSQVEAIDGQLLPNSHHDGFFYALLHKA